MKKASYLLLAVAAITLNTSCQSEVDDIFDEPSALRVETKMREYTDVLTSASNGWAVAYYGNTEFGGYNLLCKFNADQSVEVASELSGADKHETTHYSLGQSNGIILSFDQYSPIVHFFSDPVNPTYGTNGTGFGGDLEFRIKTATADSVVMSGKKHGAKIVMTPIPDGYTFETYLKRVIEVEDSMYATNYDIIVGTDTLKTRRSSRTLVYTDTIEGEPVRRILPFCVTDKGMQFYRNLEFAGKTISNFSYAPNAEFYTEQDDPSVKMGRSIMTPNEFLVEGLWYVKEEGLGTYAAAQYRRFLNTLASFSYADVNEWSLYFVCIGNYESGFGVTVAPTGELGYIPAEYYFSYEYIGDDGIRLWRNGKGNEWIDEVADTGTSFATALAPFGGTSEASARTFLITPDDPKRPSKLTLTDQNTATNVITVYAQRTFFPFGGGDQ
ncbi:MAG: DUF4302 domain-containing protein [Prevotella sp.]|nr:DUF4302 domain-containing protein [Prevotella sp.]